MVSSDQSHNSGPGALLREAGPQAGVVDMGGGGAAGPESASSVAGGTEAVEKRNPGPCWGYQFLRCADKLVPEFLYKPARAFGTAVAMLRMRKERECSRQYLRQIWGREPSVLEVFRHFFAFEEALMLKLRVANGRLIPCRYGAGEASFREWMEKGGPMLLGSMHVGVSDMLGFQIGTIHQRRVFLVRQRVANSHDTERIEAQYGEYIKFIWVNEPGELLFALKEAAETPDAIAMKCDRLEHAARSECFEFLGARRRFPFTIYHLAILFRRPVLMSVGVPGDDGRSVIHSSSRFEPLEGERRGLALERARAHFQEFLTLVEGLLKAQPYLWFNFIPLNPEETPVVPVEDAGKGAGSDAGTGSSKGKGSSKGTGPAPRPQGAGPVAPSKQECACATGSEETGVVL